MRKFLSLLLLVLLAACNLPASDRPVVATPTVDDVATQVSVLLTTMPTATPMAPVATATLAEAATATTEPTATETATPTTEPTVTASPTMLADEPDWRDRLDSGRAFYLFESDNTRVTLENGHLTLTGRTADGWHGWSLTYSQKPANFRLEAVFLTQTCSSSDIYGLVFRAPNDNSGYFFGVTCDGRYNLRARDLEDGTDDVLVNLSANAAIVQGSNATNRLEVRAEGQKLGLYANGTLLQEVTDDSFDAGYIGAFIAANDTPNFTVWMDEIMLWNLP